MTKNSGNPKSREQELAKVLKQMDDWMQHKTRLMLSISTPLFHLFLRGRVGRQEGLFLFDSYGEVCRVPVIPKNYDHVVLCRQKGSASVTFETSEMRGGLEIQEDGATAMFEEICVN